MSETKIFLTVLFVYNPLNHILNLFSLATTRLYIQGYNRTKLNLVGFFPKYGSHIFETLIKVLLYLKEERRESHFFYS